MTRQTSAHPEADNRANQDYKVYGRHQIIGTLEEVIRKRSLVTLYFRGLEGYTVTSLLHLDPARQTLLFDSAQDSAINRQIAAAQRLTFVALVDHIKTQFATAGASPAVFEQHPALRTSMPEYVLRLQRRNFFRVRAPRAVPLICAVPLPDGAVARLAIDDLSVGGIAILAGDNFAQFAPGTTFHNCDIDLPEHGVITTTLELRTQIPAASNAKQLRFGCRFVDLPGAVETRIQRYINDLERARRALS